MPERLLTQESLFLSTLQAGPGERRLALWTLILSVLLFAALAPFSKTPLAHQLAFIAAYESALIVTDTVTASLLLCQYLTLRTPSMLVLAGGYVFGALMTVVHALSFPGLFAPQGLLGGNSQSTAWIYMFWHGGFTFFICAYAWSSGLERNAGKATGERPVGRVPWPLVRLLAGVGLLAALLSLVATRWVHLLPPIMDGNHYTPAMRGVVGCVWVGGILALTLLWRRRTRSVLDIWLMVVMCAWLIDVALSAMLNQGRFDLGFYAGRLYGLLASSFVLLVLLVESGMLYRQLLQLAVTLQRISTQDSLTGLYNRRHFDAVARQHFELARRSGLCLGLALIDVDHFKRYNDHYGHQQGDEALRRVAQALRGALRRDVDLMFRIGGEEFAALIPLSGDAQEMAALADKLNQKVHALQLPHAQSPEECVTVSIGALVVTHANWLDLATAYRRADAMLYEAKAAGRNRAVVGGV